MISFRARLVRFVTRQLFRSIDADADIPSLRSRWEKIAARSRSIAGIRVKYVDIAEVECEWLVPTGCLDAPILLYLHGGAYVSGSARTHRTMVSYLARAAGMRALLPNYRLAPEHPFPAGLDDCVAVYRQLVACGMSPDNIVIAGDSAGGGMTMATLVTLRDSGDPLPAGAVLISPWLDLTASGESAATRKNDDPLFRVEEMPKAALHYAPEDLHDDPRVSPVFADAHGLPPLLIHVGDHEILLSDSTRLTEKVVEAGGEVHLCVWPHLWHVFHYFVGRMPEAARALDDIAKWLAERMGTEALAVTGTDRAA